MPQLIVLSLILMAVLVFKTVQAANDPDPSCRGKNSTLPHQKSS